MQSYFRHVDRKEMTHEEAFKDFPKDRHKKLNLKQLNINSVEDLDIDSDSHLSNESFSNSSKWRRRDQQVDQYTPGISL